MMPESPESTREQSLEERVEDAKLAFVASIESDSRLEGLLALRLMLAARLAEGVPARDLAALTRRLMQVMEELEALGADDPDGDALSPEDELAARRAAVLSAAGVERTAEGR